jgi:hypothetical protein
MILFLSLILFTALISWMYIFNIYEVDIDINNKIIRLGESNNSIIEIIPLNSFGFKTPFRKVTPSVKFIEGSELVDITKKDNNRYSIHAKSDTGKVVLLLESEYFLYPNKFTFLIKPDEAS